MKLKSHLVLGCSLLLFCLTAQTTVSTLVQDVTADDVTADNVTADNVTAEHVQIQDIVTQRSESGKPGKTITRKGTIVQWTGHSLTIHSNGADRTVDNDQIVDVQTHWSDDYTSGLALLDAGQTADAIEKLTLAMQTETRPWAQLVIGSQLVRAYQANQNPAAAIEQFLIIVHHDPQTRFIDLCPLSWVPTTQGNLVGPVQKIAHELIESREPVQQLIGASWLLMGADQETATQVLDELSRDIDANIKHLASAQLWRVRIFNLKTVNARQIAAWERQIQSMPTALRAGPWFLLADAQARTGQTDAATLNLMRIPILYPQQSELSAAALYRAGHILHNEGNTDASQTVWNELREKHPESEWASQTP